MLPSFLKAVGAPPGVRSFCSESARPEGPRIPTAVAPDPDLTPSPGPGPRWIQEEVDMLPLAPRELESVRTEPWMGWLC